MSGTNADKDAPDVLKVLQAAAKGLHWPSESDKPVKALLWKQDGASEATVDEATLRGGTKIDAAASVTAIPLDTFFAPVVTEQDWFGDAEKATMKQFQSLKDALTTHLSSVSVYRVEGAHSDRSLVDAYIVGRTDDHSIAGVSTQLVET